MTGEVSEQTGTWRWSAVLLIGAGHHATERYGVQAVGSLAAEALGLSHEFIDIDNPARRLQAAELLDLSSPNVSELSLLVWFLRGIVKRLRHLDQMWFVVESAAGAVSARRC